MSDQRDLGELSGASGESAGEWVRRPAAEVVTGEEVHHRNGSLFGTELVVVEDDGSRWLAWEGAKEAWLANLESPRTREVYETATRQFFEWAGVEPWNVGSALAQQWKAWMAKEGKVIRTNPEMDGQAPWEVDRRLLNQQVRWEMADGRIVVWDSERETAMEMGPLSDGSINVKLAALSSFYSFAQQYSTITADGRVCYLWPVERQNPFKLVKRPQVPQFGRAEFPTTDEMMAMLGQVNTQCLTGKRDYALLYAYIVTCKRFAEIIRLQWGDIWELADGNYGFRFKYKREKEKTRKGMLPRKCFQVICEYLRADGRPPEEMQAADYVFVPLYPERIRRLGGEMAELKIEANRPISNRTANRILKKYARRAGVDEKKAHIHGLRHAGARRRAERMVEECGRVDYGEIQDLLGHANIGTTMIYSKSVLEDPEDPGGEAAAEDWLVMGKRRRRKEETPAEQLVMNMGEE